MSSLDNSAAQTASDQARQNQIDFANEQERQKELGASGLTSLLGINTAAQLGTSGQAAGLASLGGGVDTSTAGGSDFSNQNYQATPDPSTTSTKTPTTGSLGTPTGKTTPSNPSGTTTKPGTDANGNPPSSPNYDPATDPGSKSYNPAMDPNSPQFDPYGTGTYSGDPTQDPGYVPPDTTPTDPFPVTDPGVAPDTTGGDGSGASPDYLSVLKRVLAMGGAGTAGAQSS
jgi:hypothetical protein